MRVAFLVVQPQADADLPQGVSLVGLSALAAEDDACLSA